MGAGAGAGAGIGRGRTGTWQGRGLDLGPRREAPRGEGNKSRLRTLERGCRGASTGHREGKESLGEKGPSLGHSTGPSLGPLGPGKGNLAQAHPVQVKKDYAGERGAGPGHGGEGRSSPGSGRDYPEHAGGRVGLPTGAKGGSWAGEAGSRAVQAARHPLLTPGVAST